MRALLAAALVVGGCQRVIDLPPAEPAPGVVSVFEAAPADGDVGWWPALLFGPNDDAHLAYCDVTRGDVRYAVRRGGQWALETVASEGSVGKYLALALDAEGRPALSFYDQTKKLLWLARPAADGTWTREPVAWGNEIGVGSELRFDESGMPHLFYYTQSAKLVHAARRGGGWDRQVIAPAVGGYSARPGVLWRDGGFWVSFVSWELADTRMTLASSGANGWRLQPLALERGGGWRTHLREENGTLTLLYSVASSRWLMEAAPDAGGRWRSRRLVDDAGGFAAAHDARGTLVIAYEDVRVRERIAGRLKLLRREDGAWRRFDVDGDAPAGDYIAAALDSKGRALVAYHSAKLRSLKLYDETGARE